jgi:type 1 glutamine amidotransferase
LTLEETLAGHWPQPLNHCRNAACETEPKRYGEPSYEFQNTFSVGLAGRQAFSPQLRHTELALKIQERSSTMFYRSPAHSIWLIMALLLTVVMSPVVAEATSLEEGKIRAMIVTGGHGFEKEPFFAMFEAIPDVTHQHVAYPDAAALLRPDLADEIDVIVFYDMWQKDLTPQQQKAFVELLNRGIGVVALHHTLAAHPNWPEYQQIIGGRYHTMDRVVDGKSMPKSGFDHGQTIHVTVPDTGHPITCGLADFEIHDETYCRYDTDPSAQVLLTTAHPKSDAELAWVKTYGPSRIFYLQLGHDHLAYENASFSELVARGIRWTAGRVANPDSEEVPLFNGKDLSGWREEGNAKWTVEDGLLVGRQGENGAAGDLLTEDVFGDFEARVTYRVRWPANSGVWYRYQSAQQAFQADILEYKQPYALSGSLYCTGKMFLATNEDPQLEDHDGWNTLVIRAVGNRHQIWLNGRKVADVRDDTSDRGSIGFQVHAGDQFNNMEIHIKEVQLRPI